MCPVVQHGISQDLCRNGCQALIPRPQRRCGSNPTTCALTQDDDTGRVDIEFGCMCVQPGDTCVHIVQGRRVGVLWCHVVVGREDLGPGPLSEARDDIKRDSDTASDQGSSKDVDDDPVWARVLALLLYGERDEARDVELAAVS